MLVTSFETATKLKPSHPLHRQESLEKLREELGFRGNSVQIIEGINN